MAPPAILAGVFVTIESNKKRAPHPTGSIPIE